MSPAWFSIATLMPASVIFEREFFSTATSRLDVLLDAAPAVRAAAEHRPDDGGADDLRGVDHLRQLFLGCALRLVEHRRGGTDRAHADLEIEAELVGVGAHFAQVVRLEVAEEPDLAEVHDLDVPLGREIQLLERRPVLRAEAVHVDAESHRRLARLLRGRQARAGSGVAPSASVAAPRVFTNVRRSAGMSSSWAWGTAWL